MKKHLITFVLLLALVMLSSCARRGGTATVQNNGFVSGINTDRPLLVESVSYNKGASVFETQYVYEIESIEFDGDFSEEAKANFRSHRFAISSQYYEAGEWLCLSGYTAGDIYISTRGEAALLRPKVVEKEDTFLIYWYRHFFRGEVDMIDSIDNPYNEIWECPKQDVVIKYVVE